MRIRFKAVTLVAAAGALAIAVPAAAHPNGSNHPNGSDHPNGNAQNSHRCAPHNVAYIVAGTVADGTSMTQDSGATTWSGTLVVTVAHTNHWAKGTSGTFTLSGVKVKFAGGATTFTTGERVKVIGKLPVVRSHGKNSCQNAGPGSTPTIRMVVVHPASGS